MDTEKRNNESLAAQQKKQGLAFNETLSSQKVLKPNFINPAAFDKTKALWERAAASKKQEINAKPAGSVVNPIPAHTGVPLQPTINQPQQFQRSVVNPINPNTVVQPRMDNQQPQVQPVQVPVQPIQVPPVHPQTVQQPIQPEAMQVPPTQQPVRDQFVPEPVLSQRKPNIEIKLPENEPVIKADRFSQNTDIPANPTEEDRDAGAFVKRQETKKQGLPTKHKRWIMILLIILLILLAYLWLKPKGETVDAFQAQTKNGNTLPIEYQPLDQENNKPTATGANPGTEPPPVTGNNPTNIALENPRPDAPAGAGQKRTMSLLVGDENKLVDSAATTAAANATNNPNAANTQTQPQVSNGTALPTPNVSSANNPSAVPATTRVAPKPVANTTTEPQPRIVDGARAVRPRPATTATPPVTDRQADRPRTEPVRTADVRKSSSSDVTERKVVSPAKPKTPVVEAKSTTGSTPEANKTESAVGTTKVLTIPRGVSLMQVFRDNNLDIRDVNAMTKASGAAQVLNNLHAGDKIRLVVSDNGQVKELRLSSGARFIRQSDGSYIYQK